jgi:PAS domain S-box-containing protein
MEVTVTCKDGSSRHVRISLASAGSRNIVTFEDLTERKQAEELLKNMATKYRAMFDSSSDAIMLLDEKVFFDCNPATLRIFGSQSRDDFINKHPAQISPPTQPGGKDSTSLANQHIAAAFKIGSILFEWTHRRLDGTEFPAEVLLTAMELDGKPVLQATVRDITERNQTQSRLAEQIEELRRWHDATLGREMRTLELKHEVNELLGKAGQPPRYPSAEADDRGDSDV